MVPFCLCSQQRFPSCSRAELVSRGDRVFGASHVRWASCRRGSLFAFHTKVNYFSAPEFIQIWYIYLYSIYSIYIIYNIYIIYIHLYKNKINFPNAPVAFPRLLQFKTTPNSVWRVCSEEALSALRALANSVLDRSESESANRSIC